MRPLVRVHEGEEGPLECMRGRKEGPLEFHKHCRQSVALFSAPL